MSIRVRPFRDSDYTAFARIKRTGEREPVTADEARAHDRRWDHSRFEKVRVVAVDEEDAPIGYGEIYHEPSRYEPRRYFVRLAIEPARRRHGAGYAIWEHLRAELEERAALVACLWMGDATACQPFMVKRGFVEVIRSYEQVLALATAPLPLAAAEKTVASCGIAVETLAQLRLRAGDDGLRRTHELYTDARLDQPTLGHVMARPFDDWRREIVDAPNALPDAYFLARDGERLVGCSAVRRSAEDELRIVITAVLPEYRRRGIARLLKLRVHAWARAHGYREIHTSTATSNLGMVALNTSLGYVIVDSWGGYELKLSN
ncbi:MAG: hypothetical protein AUH33_02210 [Chloroflexi bacterium 13_1_40CM_68_21]|nr:MAG: hypothetical protein AUH33_02210 [Chloroflexi bacterium 13_1_40CM_68_21]